MSLPPDYFDEAWRDDPDPWRIADRWYERRKRDLLLAALPRERFGRVLELGCAAGHLSERLVERCDQLLACDGAAGAVARARQRLGPRALVEQRWLPEQWPAGRFDLVVVSEMAYYLGADDLDRLAARVKGCLTADGVLVACHWRHPAPGYPGTADGVHERLGALGLRSVARHQEPDLLLDVWGVGEPSVARAEGWL